ncbi:uncharacterized protein P884DRAFT_260788 [Thermothelomyces heterothallicus CBS 202.75]|uniref:uncharacterized protein n=1 Tax=Thermothelomyces heterothallicus CBS 202.75 TaxID=1149848 RepID=UPI0037449CB3
MLQTLCVSLVGSVCEVSCLIPRSPAKDKACTSRRLAPHLAVPALPLTLALKGTSRSETHLLLRGSGPRICQNRTRSADKLAADAVES